MMSQNSLSIPNGYQVRTDATKAMLMKAAETVFIRDGYEGAQLDSIAKAANRSKGAIYAHFKSKEDLFLALYAYRTRSLLDQLAERLKTTRNREDVVRQLKTFLVEVAKDKTWALLTLEFRLYAVRHPESQKRLIELAKLAESLGKEVLARGNLGDLSAEQERNLSKKTIALTPLICSFALESYFHPEASTDDSWAILTRRYLDVTFEDLN